MHRMALEVESSISSTWKAGTCPKRTKSCLLGACAQPKTEIRLLEGWKATKQKDPRAQNQVCNVRVGWRMPQKDKILSFVDIRQAQKCARSGKMLKLGQRWALEDENHWNQLSTSWRMPQKEKILSFWIMHPSKEWRSLQGASQKDNFVFSNHGLGQGDVQFEFKRENSHTWASKRTKAGLTGKSGEPESQQATSMHPRAGACPKKTKTCLL